MSRALPAALLAAWAVIGQARAAEPPRWPQVTVEELTLGNGLRVLLVPRPESRMVSAGWVAKVGSVDEGPGLTGLTHLLEHLFFKGTETLATGELARLYTEAGARGLNALTLPDMTLYFVTLPAEKLELWFWLESDRLLAPVFRELASEKSVVAEERRLRIDSTPTGLLDQQLRARFWGDHPYGWPTLGWPEDVAATREEDARRHFASHYRAGNVVLVLVGKLDRGAVQALSERYFGRLPAGRPPEPPDPDLVRPNLANSVQPAPAAPFTAACECRPQVQVLYPSVPFGHQDSAALEVLAGLMNGRTGRLYRRLVLGRELASTASVLQTAMRHAGSFTVSAEAKGATTPAELLAAWDAELERLRREPIPAEELAKVKNQILADGYRSLRDPLALTLRLLMSEGFGGWRETLRGPERAWAVQGADVVRVVDTYLRPERRTVGMYTRGEAGAPPRSHPERSRGISAAGEGGAVPPREGLKSLATDKRPSGTGNRPRNQRRKACCQVVTPAKAGVHPFLDRGMPGMDSRFRGNDGTSRALSSSRQGRSWVARDFNPSRPAAVPPRASPIPAHPRELSFPSLPFEVPDAERYRHRLSNGVPVYVVPDKTLPLVDVAIALRAGAWLEPPERTGLAGLTASMLRRAGTATLTPEELDERVDRLALELDASAGSLRAGAQLNAPSWLLDEGLDLLFDVLRRPRFDPERLEHARRSLADGLSSRNDDPGAVLEREWGFALYGSDHFTQRPLTPARLAAIRREDLVEFHRRWWQPAEMVVAISGDVEPAAVLAALERGFAGWAVGEKAPWPPPSPPAASPPGVYLIERDLAQAKVLLGQRTARRSGWEDRSAEALSLLGELLGGRGARIPTRLRREAGLAYRAGARLTTGELWPGELRIQFETGGEKVGLAVEMALAEIERLRQTSPTEAELAFVRKGVIDGLPFQFDTAEEVAGTFAEDDLLGRPHRTWRDLPGRLATITPEEIRRAAVEVLSPQEMILLVAGRSVEIERLDPGQKTPLSLLVPGVWRHLPERDPLTLEPRPPAPASPR
ncbi:MAG TPA: pitrilysin family protein [Thermoanaerobaculia bacterium]|nr:pitrilysin family protein [Thermoanaerobaculia bacterium]